MLLESFIISMQWKNFGQTRQLVLAVSCSCCGHNSTLDYDESLRRGAKVENRFEDGEAYNLRQKLLRHASFVLKDAFWACELLTQPPSPHCNVG